MTDGKVRNNVEEIIKKLDFRPLARDSSEWHNYYIDKNGEYWREGVEGYKDIPYLEKLDGKPDLSSFAQYPWNEYF